MWIWFLLSAIPVVGGVAVMLGSSGRKSKHASTVVHVAAILVGLLGLGAGVFATMSEGIGCGIVVVVIVWVFAGGVELAWLLVAERLE